MYFSFDPYIHTCTCECSVRLRAPHFTWTAVYDHTRSGMYDPFLFSRKLTMTTHNQECDDPFFFSRKLIQPIRKPLHGIMCAPTCTQTYSQHTHSTIRAHCTDYNTNVNSIHVHVCLIQQSYNTYMYMYMYMYIQQSFTHHLIIGGQACRGK